MLKVYLPYLPPSLRQMLHDRTSLYEFTNLVKELETAGVLFSDKQYSFDFATVDKPYDSYTGLNVRLRYFLKVTVTRQYAPNLLAEQELVVQSTTEPPASHSSIKMEVRPSLPPLPPSLSVCLRYFLRATVTRQFAPNLLAEPELVVQTTTEPPASYSSIKMEVYFLLFLLPPPSLPHSLLPFFHRFSGHSSELASCRCVRLLQ